MHEHILDTLTSGVRTTEAPADDPYGFHVSSIAWDSGFRRSGLRIGDLVVACGEVNYQRDRREFMPCAFGSAAENQLWQEHRTRDGDDATITVLRGSQSVHLTGKVLAERSWQNERGRRTLGPGGPERLANDGFSRPWADWLERQLQDMASRVLDDGWRRGTVHNNRQMLEEHLAQKPRVDFLLQRYPGPFATAVAEDWEDIRVKLEGRRYDIGADELGWRSLGEQRKEHIAAVARQARNEYQQQVAQHIVPAFPAVNPMRDERAAVAGKIVILPRMGNSDWSMDAGRAWLVARDRSGAYFIDSQSRGMQRAFMVRWQYERSVAPYLAETWEIIGRIGPNPKMLVIDEVAVPGLLVEPLAVNIGDAVFVDVSADGAAFAGQESLAAISSLALDDTAGPAEVMNAFVLAVKLGNEAFWKNLFAPWDAVRIEGQVWYQPLSGPASSNSLATEWIRARRVLEKLVYDVRVVAVDDVTTVVTPDAFEHAPLIERATVEVDHIGLFDGEYRAFKDINVTRLWSLQRRDGGPWRIATARGI